MGILGAFEPSELLSFTSSVLLFAFAIAVGALGRFRGPSLWFTLFEGGFALAAGLDNIQQVLEADGAVRQPLSTWASDFPSTLAAGTAIVGLALLLLRFPTRVTRAELLCAWPALIVISLLLAQSLWHNVEDAREHASWSLTAILVDEANSLAFNVLRALMLAGGLLLGVRYAFSATAAADRRAMALVAAALVIYPVSLAMRGGWDEALALQGDAAMWFFVVLAGAIAIAAYWGRAATVAGRWTGWLVAWTVLAAALGGALVGAYAPDWSTSGPSRILAILILGYAVLRNQLPGLDVKVRVAISKSTLAGVFVAVFFVASEAAQQFFGERFESGYLGILAAGALVFAFAPLSRLADRVAVKAVPANAAPSTDTNQANEHYRVLLRRYLGDGHLSRDEELALARAADGMGIPAHDALRLRHEVEDENSQA